MTTLSSDPKFALDPTLCNQQIEAAAGQSIYSKAPFPLFYDSAAGMSALEAAVGAPIFSWPDAVLDPALARAEIDAYFNNLGSP
jgi:hypothetical protein